MDLNVCRSITSERIRHAIKGYSYPKQKGKREYIEGLAGSFSYCELENTLFDATGQIREEVSFEDLARHIFFVETGEPLSACVKGDTPLIGNANGIAVYLLYNGVLRDKAAQGGDVLTNAVLAGLPPHDGPKVIYGTSCLVGPQRLKRAGVTFRQIPYEVRTA